MHEGIIQSSKKVGNKYENLSESCRIESNITAAVTTLSKCIPVFVAYSKLQKQIFDKR